MKSKYCKKCGEKLLEGTSFCTKCGAKIDSSQNGLFKKSSTITKNVIFGIISAIFLLAALGAFSEASVVSGVCMMLIGLLALPIRLWQNILTEKIKLNKWIKIGAATVLFVLLGFFVGTEEPVDVPKVDLNSQSSSVEQVLEQEVSSESSQSIYESSISSSVPSNESGFSSSSVTPSSSSKYETSSETVFNDVSENSTFSIHFIDVGQADAALVECDGEYMLVDGGNVADSDRIYSVLKNVGANHLKIVVGTHAHEDHIGGLSGAFNYAAADITLCPVISYDSKAFENFAKYVKSNGGGITVPKVGNTYSLGSAMVTIVGINGGSDTNDTSIILKIQYGKTSFLFTGDAEWVAENAATYSGYDLSATVLKVGHHGSDTSTGYVFLRSVMPEYAVISVGKGNSYGHPHESVLSRLHDAGTKVFRTDLQGDIYCFSDGETVTFSVQKNENIDTFIPGNYESSSSFEASKPSSSSSSENNEKTYDYVLNINSKKFHYSWCASVKRMKEANKKFVTGTRDEIIAMGYEPCQNCNP